jgi:hypothetical protein
MLGEYKEKRHDKYAKGSSKKLRAAMKHKIKRTFIGTLDALEQELRASNIPNWEDVFKKMRARILTIGNDQLRNVDIEIDKYNVEFIPYHIEFKLKDQ